MNENVYQTPESDSVYENEYDEYEVASTGQRFLTLIIDYVGYIVMSFFTGIVLGLAGFAEGLSEMNGLLLAVSIITLYYVPQEALFGRTLGKLITGTKVVDLDGNKIGFLRAVGRTLSRFIPFDAFSFFGGGGRPQGWHDKVSKTKVISLR